MGADTEHDAHDDAQWLRGLSNDGVSAPQAGDAAGFLPPINRERPRRRPVIPRFVWLTTLGFAVVVALAVAAGAWIRAESIVDTPNLVGEELGVARTTCARLGLSLEVAERRFSLQPVGRVLEQSPSSGSPMRRGDIVEVVVSAGTEEFAMPDVIGDGVALATGVLEDKGLVVDIDRVISDAPSDTVLSSTPAPGTTVRTGDRVRLEVASPRDDDATLRPYDLSGAVIVIDPAPVPHGLTRDPCLDVARRLQAMASASGASVIVLRSTLDTDTSDAARGRRSSAATATVSIGLAVASGREPGRVVSAPATGAPGVEPTSSVLARNALVALEAAAPPVQRNVASFDPVLGGDGEPWIRVLLGSTDRADQALYEDPRWADSIARALYRAIGETVGVEVAP